MASKFYAVKAGRVPGIYNSWEECKAQIDGFSCASYKSFQTVDEAAIFMDWKSDSASNSKPIIDDNNTAIAYVDGSYNISTGTFGYGIVFFFDDDEIHLKEGFNNPELASMRNVAGEIKGSEVAIKYAISKGIKAIKIYHDYEGIAKWCTGEWKANKEGTIAYKKFYDSIKEKIHVEFVKVKGHSGDKYNDVADMLAKQAAGVE